MQPAEGQPSRFGPGASGASVAAQAALNRGQRGGSGRKPGTPGGGANKYGVAPKERLIHKDVKYFDSADWALSKEGQEAPGEMLQPKLQPDEPPGCSKTAGKSALSRSS
mmetsp:Transcript_19487/g.23336  ORF Transcript_19487/g.23336 Transcript_19487/m.23336 type:complete len:109 (-) Transcript_19487:674-1000(-)